MAINRIKKHLIHLCCVWCVRVTYCSLFENESQNASLVNSWCRSEIKLFFYTNCRKILQLFCFQIQIALCRFGTMPCPLIFRAAPNGLYRTVRFACHRAHVHKLRNLRARALVDHEKPHHSHDARRKTLYFIPKCVCVCEYAYDLCDWFK